MSLGGVAAPNADLDELESAVDHCLETPVSCLSRQELSERLARQKAISAKIAAMRVETVAAAATCDVGVLSDQRNVANHVASITNTDPADIRFEQRIAAWLTAMPVIAAALRAGEITVAHVELLRLADNPRVHMQMIDSQELFVSWFTTVAFRDLSILLDEWTLGADPDGAEPSEHDKHTGMTIRTLAGGMVKIEILMNPVEGSACKGDLAGECKRLCAEEQEAGQTKSVRKRQLQAFLNLTGRGAARPDGTHARPRVHIVMSQRVYEQTLAWLEDPVVNDLPTVDRTDVDSKSQLIDGTPIHPVYGVAASLTAKFRHTVYSARGRPIHDSYDTRSIPDWMREIALITSNGKCSNPVCDAPFAWLHGDHITPYSHTRDTSVANTRPVCEADNGWRGNDTDRGIWGQTEPPPVNERAAAYQREQHETALARSRVHALAARNRQAS